MGVLCITLSSNSRIFAYQETNLVDKFIVNKYSKDDVLPTNTVTDIHIAASGMLYAASNEGLIVHDGLNWDVLNKKNSPDLLSDRILKIFETSGGHIFIQDQSNYLYSVNIQKQVVNIKDPLTNQPMVVKAAAEDSERLTVVTENQLVTIHSDLTVKTRSHSINGVIWDLVVIGDTTYVISSKALYALTNSEESVIKEEFSHVDIDYFTSLDMVSNTLLITGNGGIDCIPFNEQGICDNYSFKSMDGEKVYHLSSKAKNGSIISTNKRLIQKQQTIISNLYNHEGLMYESVLNIGIDEFLLTSGGVWSTDQQIYSPRVEVVDAASDGENIWLTSDQRGIVQIKQNQFTHFTSPGLVNSYSVIEQNSNIWGGSFEYGFSKAEPEAMLISTDSHSLPNNTIRMMASLQNGGILISTWGEKPVLYRNGEIARLPELDNIDWLTTNVAEGLYEFADGALLIGTIESLILIDDDKSVTILTDDSGAPVKGVSRIVADPFSDKLYLCSQFNGLYVFEGNKVESIVREGDPLHIRDIYFSSPGKFWAATYSSGLVRYTVDQNNKIVETLTLDEALGLPGVGVHKFIKVNDDELWMSSNNGLFKVNNSSLDEAVESGKPLQSLQVFTEKDGLLNREFNGGSQNTGLLDSKGNVWFANQSGLVRFNPATIKATNSSIDNFYIRDFSNIENNAQWIAPDSVLISGRSDEFSFNYAHISSSQNHTDNIWYTVNGEEWIYPTWVGKTNTIDLPKGEVDVQFAVYPEKEAFYTLSIIRNTPLVNQVWFRMLIASLIFMGIFILLLMRRRFRTHDHSNSQSAAKHEKEPEKTEIELITEFIYANYQNPDYNLDDLAKDATMSRSTMYRVWGKERDDTLNEFLLSVRLQKGIELLVEEGKTITEAAELAGFRSQSYFSKVFKKYYGLSPTKYLEQRNAVNS